MKKLLLFGSRDPGEILHAAATAKTWGAEVCAVPRGGWGMTIGDLAAGKDVPADGRPGAVQGQMLVFCGLEEELDALLTALRRAGVSGLVAVMTDTNRRWSAHRLYRELEQERRRLEGKAPPAHP